MKRYLFIIQMEHVFGMGQSVSGTVQRSEHIINALTRIGKCDVLVVKANSCQQGCSESLVGWLGSRGEVFVSDGSKESSPIVHRIIRRMLRMMGCSVLEQNYVPNKTCSMELRECLRNTKYDLIICRYIRSAIASGALRQKTIGVAVDLDDDPLEIARVQHQENSSSTSILSLWMIRRMMQHLLSKCSHVWGIKSSDADNYPDCSISILPNIPVFPETPVCDSDEAGFKVLFVGLLGWQPNAVGLSRFIKSAWPEVIAKRKDAVLQIVGGGVNDELRRLMADSEGVEYLGWQKSLLPSYEEATVCICPVYQGGGSKIKILEALAHRRPMVITEQAYDGVKDDLSNGKDLLVAADDSDFARSVLHVMENPREARRLADNGYEVIVSRFSNEAFYKQVSGDVESVFQTGENSDARH